MKRLIVKEKLDNDKASLIWDEYKYRHDLIWKHMIRTTIAVIGSITLPFTVDESWSDSGHARTVIVVVFVAVIIYLLLTIWIIHSELKLFRDIKKIHRYDQLLKYRLHINKSNKKQGEIEETHDESSLAKSRFELRVYLLLSLLFLCAVTNLIYWITLF